MMPLSHDRLDRPPVSKETNKFRLGRDVFQIPVRQTYSSPRVLVAKNPEAAIGSGILHSSYKSLLFFLQFTL